MELRQAGMELRRAGVEFWQAGVGFLDFALNSYSKAPLASPVVNSRDGA
jgi:hypothetical protein